MLYVGVHTSICVHVVNIYVCVWVHVCMCMWYEMTVYTIHVDHVEYQKKH